MSDRAAIVSVQVFLEFGDSGRRALRAASGGAA
jgi:hypothetical protein